MSRPGTAAVVLLAPERFVHAFDIKLARGWCWEATLCPLPALLARQLPGREAPPIASDLEWHVRPGAPVGGFGRACQARNTYAQNLREGMQGPGQ